jgi:hypothetical protein
MLRRPGAVGKKVNQTPIPFNHLSCFLSGVFAGGISARVFNM